VSEGHFATHLKTIRAAYRRRRDVMASALRQDSSLGIEFSLPRGGFYIWCRIPEGVEESALLADAAACGVVFLPGRACFATDPPEHFIRLNFSHASEEAIKIGIERLLDAVREAAADARPLRKNGPITSPVV
jgi:DNA-binding transcriptional MocR family regulator